MDQQPSNSSWGTLEWCVIAVSAALFLTAVRPYFGLTADDAYISFRYAQNWAAGCGPVYSCGEQPVEGYTNFLWTGIAALVIWLGHDVASVMRVAGLGCGFGALVAAMWLCRRVHGHRAAMVVPLVALGSSPFWALNSVTGLETTAATLTVLLAARLSLDLHRGGRRLPWLAGLAWALSYLVRPEALALAAVTGLWALAAGLISRQGWKQTLVRCAQYGGGFLALAGPYFIWRLVYYGSLHPNTFYAKKIPLDVVLPRNLKLLSDHPLFFLTLAVSAVLVLLASALRKRGGGSLYLLLLALVSAGISLSVHNNFWMPGHRLYLTAVMLLAVMAGGVADFGAVLRGGRLRWLSVAAMGLCLGLVLYTNLEMTPRVIREAELHYARDNHPARKMGQRIRAMARPGQWLAIRDAGMVPFFSGTTVKVLDMHDHSLNDRRIARKGWDLKYVLGRDLRFVVFASHTGGTLRLTHPIEGRILHSPGFQAKYKQIMTVAWHNTRHFFLYARIGK